LRSDGRGPGRSNRGSTSGKYSIPSYSTCDHSNYKVTNGATVNLTAGTYCGGISIGGSVGTVNFGPGNYILADGGMSVNGSANLNGTGVTFFDTYKTQANKYGAISINGSGTVSLTAPTSGTYKALLFYQDPRVSWSASNGSTISGSATSMFDGIIYFPTTDLQYSGNSGTSSSPTSGYTVLIGYNIKINGTATINTDFSSIGGSNPIQNVLFAE
jgi:hypothetical protein